MRCMVTGATGLIGSRLVNELLRQDFQVNVLVRSPGKLQADIREKINVFKGDILDKSSINPAMEGCNVVFHLAAFAGIWSKDKMLPYKTNVTGTRNILEAALENEINKVVFTSTAGTLATSSETKPVDENTPLPDTYYTDYEMSKRQAEQFCDEYGRLGLDIVIVNPTRVYGPGPLNKSNSVAVIIKNYLAGRWRFVPGSGRYNGNYAFVNDVAAGHVLALMYGVPGEKYILGGANATFNEFFRQLAEVSGKKYRMLHIPFPLIQVFSQIELLMARSIGKMPLITPPWAKRYRQNRLVSSGKAITALGYEITTLPAGIKKTIGWLQSQQ